MKSTLTLHRLLLMVCAFALSLGATQQANATDTYIRHTWDTYGKQWDTDRGGWYWSIYKQTNREDKSFYPNNGGYVSITTNYVSSVYNAAGQFAGEWKLATDVIIGKGWARGAYGNVINYNYSSFTNSGGIGFLTAYGWLNGGPYGKRIEYYVVEATTAPYTPTSSTKNKVTYEGTFSSDGSTYKVYLIKMGITGTNVSDFSFWQVRSVRIGNSSKSVNHKITMANHFNRWSNKLSWTSHSEMQFGIEAYDYGTNKAAGNVNCTIW